MSILETVAEIFPDEIFRSKFRTDKTLWCFFRRGKDRLKTAAAMTFEDPWYGDTCHMMMLPRQNKNDATEFRMTR